MYKIIDKNHSKLAKKIKKNMILLKNEPIHLTKVTKNNNYTLFSKQQKSGEKMLRNFRNFRNFFKKANIANCL